MPAWITSLLRDEVSVPKAPAASRINVSRPESARARAIVSPTAPAPMTMASKSGIAGDPSLPLARCQVNDERPNVPLPDFSALYDSLARAQLLALELPSGGSLEEKVARERRSDDR